MVKVEEYFVKGDMVVYGCLVDADKTIRVTIVEGFVVLKGV